MKKSEGEARWRSEDGQTDYGKWVGRVFPWSLKQIYTDLNDASAPSYNALQRRLCIGHHVSSSLPPSPLLFYCPLTSPTTSFFCKVRVAKFKSQSECRLGVLHVYIGHPFVCIFACSSTPRVSLYVCIFYVCCCTRDCLKFLAICENARNALITTARLELWVCNIARFRNVKSNGFFFFFSKTTINEI